MKSLSLFIIATVLFEITACNPKSVEDNTGWKIYGGDNAHTHYSSLTAIDTNNVANLQVAWVYHTGDSDHMSQIQVNPVMIDGVLYGVSPRLTLFALNATTGKPLWTFNDSVNRGSSGINACRGVTYYENDSSGERIFYGAGSWLYCVNATNGKPVLSFADSGRLDLHNDLGRNVKDLYVVMNSPGIIYEDMIIIGDRVSEEAAAAPGHIRAYDVHSGKLRWIFHTVPQPGEIGYDSWDDPEAYKHIGGANAWAGFTLDAEKGILFAPVGSASYDFYGGRRTGDDLFANCVLALDARTGKRIWHYQTVHHDVWDRDPPTAPVLVTVKKDGRDIEAVAQPTKTGFIFLLDRNTGEPVYPIKEVAVPTTSPLAGEKLSPTQPMPDFPEPFARQALTADILNDLGTDSTVKQLQRQFAAYKTGSMFTPPSREGTIIFPGTDGGAEWGGPAYDPATGILYINANEIPWVLTMVDAAKKMNATETNLSAGIRLYNNNCRGCHGAERQGAGNAPSLTGVAKKYNAIQFQELLTHGRRMMPAFGQLSPGELSAIEAFVLENKSKQQLTFQPPADKDSTWNHLPYASTGYNKFLTADGYPAVKTPWGTLNAIDLNTGKLIWKQTLGDYPELKAKGIHSGTENYGGPVVTAGGLVFIAATSDAKMRAFNKRTGQLLWETDLPACGFATPSMYQLDGRQYLVIACGGGKLGKPSGDAYVAFALPPASKN